MRILFAIDIHEPDLDLRLSAGRLWVERLGGVVDLLYVTPEFGDFFFHEGPELGAFQQEVERIRQRHQQALDELRATIPEAHRGGTSLLAATRVGEAIAEQAKGYDLLIVHTHGRAGLAHLFMGSVTEKVVRLAKVPTLVLRVPSGGA